jgi:hypothetical protein
MIDLQHVKPFHRLNCTVAMVSRSYTLLFAMGPYRSEQTCA